MGKIGIDVSTHNGVIDWKKAKSQIDFAIIRAGYGNNCIDGRALDYIAGCEREGIPYGLYWFSYALSIGDVVREANALCDLADKYHPTYPLCFDWEYDSDAYAKKCGVMMTNDKRRLFAQSFLDTVEARGYYAMLYTNLDYLNKGFAALQNRYDIWLAQWGPQYPSVSCGIWQCSDSGTVSGISGYCDRNVAYKNYPEIIKNLSPDIEEDDDFMDELSDSDISAIIQELVQYTTDVYYPLALDIISGKYSNGDERKRLLRELGYDYEIAQIFVNQILSDL